MEILILGCGTSTGVPVIGCGCGVCASANPKNRRTRSSALIRAGEKNILIDTSTDLRIQSLANNISRIHAVLYTHPHADHTHGIDELRTFNMHQKAVIPCYSDARTAEDIRKSFAYIFTENDYDGWKPQLSLDVVASRFELFGLFVTPIAVNHGKSVITGYRVGEVAYLTDCSGVPDGSMEQLTGLKVLIVGALRKQTHPSHFNIDEAVELAMRLKPERTVLTHLSHNIDFEKDSTDLPEGVEFAYDGMVIEG